MNAPQRHVNLLEEQGIKQRVKINLLKQTTGGPVATHRDTHEDEACKGVHLDTLPLQHQRSGGILCMRCDASCFTTVAHELKIETSVLCFHNREQ